MRSLWQAWEAGLSGDIVDKIISLAGEAKEATTFNGAGSEARQSRVSWLTGNQMVLELLYNYADAANQAAFGAHIFKKADVQFTEYHASEGGHYNWHHDINWNANNKLDRKLSITVQLSSPDEYEGGEFEFNECESPKANVKARGTVLVFPSYLQHKVKPVTSGVRKSLVAWFEGPRWRQL